MLHKLSLEHILFLDIETVPQTRTFKELSSEKQHLWEEKSKYQRKEEFTAEEYYDRAGIWAEFGKIACISVGFFKNKEDSRTFRLTTFKGEETKILTDFSNLLNTHFYKEHHLLCAHNGKEFDFPFIARRMLVNGYRCLLNLISSGKNHGKYLIWILWNYGNLETIRITPP